MPKYTKEQRAQIAEAFRVTRDNLGRRTRYICITLQDYKPPGWDLARGIIEQRLGNHVSVRSWLDGNSGRCPGWPSVDDDVPNRAAVHEIRSRLANKYRILWLNSLIKEFSK